MATDPYISDTNLNASATGAPQSIPFEGAVTIPVVAPSPRLKITNTGPLPETITTLQQATQNWPRSVAGTLFIDDSVDGIHYFDRRGAAGLMGWMRSQFDVQWEGGPGRPTQAEFFAEVERTAPRYGAIELLPHEPLIDDIYYRGTAPAAGNGKYLRQLLDRFNPETTVDRDLIQAAFMTPLWGGPAGRRPVFVITADAGRGAGKSTIPELISHLCGGHIDVSAGDNIEAIKTRMLTNSARTKRLAIIDNVKSMRFSWAEFEAAVTSPVISGRQLYVGEGQRPNLLTWFVTLNGIAMATDLAQRSVIIKIKRASYSGTWLEDTYDFVNKYREQIIADIIGALRAEPFPLDRYTRWGSWEAGVLARLPEPGEAQRLILERQDAANVELDEAEIIEEYFAGELSRLNYNPREVQVRIPVAVVAEWFKRATGDARIGVTTASKRLRQMIAEEQIVRLDADLSRTYGRSFVWTGVDADPFGGIVNDLSSRMSIYGLSKW